MLKTIRYDDGLCAWHAIINDKEYHLEPCDGSGRDWDEDELSPCAKLVETTYKNKTDRELVADILELAEHPKAKFWEGQDEDGDWVWRVWFRVSDFGA